MSGGRWHSFRDDRYLILWLLLTCAVVVYLLLCLLVQCFQVPFVDLHLFQVLKPLVHVDSNAIITVVILRLLSPPPLLQP